MSTMTQEPLLKMQGVCKYFPGVKALDDVSIKVYPGQVMGLVGENGAGKSTLMKILSGVYKKDVGTVVFNGETIESTTPLESLKRGLSIIYQELSLINTMTVGENVFLGRFREMGGMKAIHEKATELLESIGCNFSSKTLVGKLSVSEKQMVEIAKALSFDAKLIIMDEPSSSLTVEELKKLAKIIENLKKNNIAVIYITHKLEEIFDFCDAVTVMRDGKVIGTSPIDQITSAQMISMMVGRTIENNYPERPHCQGETILKVEGLNTKKLHDVSFELKKGEILGFVGLVGAGRSETVRAIFGADRVKGYNLMLNGKPITILKPADAKKYGIAMVPENRKEDGLILPFSVSTNIVLAAFSKLKGKIFLHRTQESGIAEKHVKALQIKTPSISTAVRGLSGGNQQKCILGRWMEMEPTILIMDEPTKGIDVGAKYEIYVLMKKIVENGGAIIMISSELPEVLNMSNRVLTMYEGRITGEFDPSRVPVDVIMARALGRKEV